MTVFFLNQTYRTSRNMDVQKIWRLCRVGLTIGESFGVCGIDGHYICLCNIIIIIAKSPNFNIINVSPIFLRLRYAHHLRCVFFIHALRIFGCNCLTGVECCGSRTYNYINLIRLNCFNLYTPPHSVSLS